MEEKNKDRESLIARLMNFKRMIQKNRSRGPYYAFKAGFDCGYSGPNENNSHFSIFTYPANKSAWERGRRKGKQLRRQLENERLENA